MDKRRLSGTLISHSIPWLIISFEWPLMAINWGSPQFLRQTRSIHGVLSMRRGFSCFNLRFRIVTLEKQRPARPCLQNRAEIGLRSIPWTTVEDRYSCYSQNYVQSHYLHYLHGFGWFWYVLVTSFYTGYIYILYYMND